MMRKARWCAVAAGAGLILFLNSVDTLAQQTTAEDADLSLQVLARHVEQLNAAILELRSEVSRSRQENVELRGELRLALEKLAYSKEAASENSGEAPSADSGHIATAELPQLAAQRLDEIEEDHQLLKGKVEEQYQTKVESASKYRMRLTGMVLLNAFANRGRVDNQDVPNFALRRGPTDTSGDFGATARQSQLGFEVYGPNLAGARASAELHLDFFGGFPTAANGVTAGLARLRTATARLDWERTSVIVGQDTPFFSPLSPTSIASLGYPSLAYSGNLWMWIPQARVEHRFNVAESQNISIQGGFADPLVGDLPYSDAYRSAQAGEKSRQPAYASRLAWSRGESDRVLSLGLGGYYSRQNYGAGRTADGWATTTDWRIPFGAKIAVSGEFYRGRGIGGLGAAQDRSAVFSGPQSNPASSVYGLNSTGGWTQLKFKATDAIEFNAAYGQDEPYNEELRRWSPIEGDLYAPISKNETGLFNVIYRPRTDLVFSLEYRRLNTWRITTTDRNSANHLNFGIGVLF
jgi:hypothetical protein